MQRGTNNPVIPQIAQAFQNDPRTKLAQQLIQAGGSTAPVAQGGWAVTDGLARALQGVVGGYVQKQEQKKYKAEEADYMDASRTAMAAALAGGNPAPTPMVAQPAPAAAMTAQPAQQPLPGGGGMSAPSLGQWTGDTGQPQGGIVPAARNVGTPRRFNSGELATAAREFIPGVNVTSGVRSVAHNAEVGGKPNSQHVRGTAIDIVPPKGMTPAQVRAQYASRGAQVDVIDEGDHYHIQGARNPRKVQQSQVAGASVANTATQQQAAPLPAPETPLPELPAMPEAPADVGAVQSQRLQLGRELMQSDNRFAFQQGQDYLDKGLTEQNNANEGAADRKFRSQESRYSAAMGDYYGARSDQRQDAYSTRRQERQFQFEDTQAEKAFGRQLTVQERGFAHDMQRAGYDRETSYGLAQLNNNADLQRTMLQISATRATADEKRAQARTAFLNTPAGAKMWQSITDKIAQNDGVVNDVKEFLRLNEKTTTGGTILGSNTLSTAVRSLTGNKSLQDMESITAKLAPMLRAAGSGAMSDKDLAGFRASLPSVQNVGAANKSIGTRIINSMNRVNDFEGTRLSYLSEGKQAEFNRDWQAFKNAVPVASGKTFDEWRANLRTVQ